jgi:hypothetical protein
VCPSHNVFVPEPEAESVYRELYELYRKIYFEFGSPRTGAAFGEVLPMLIRIARQS